eukprot:scaffold3766_cov124-Isochrysis_galbana.AAC.9
MCGSWAHHVALHWAARVAGWQWHGHAQCGRRTGRGSGARVSGLRLHANLKLGNTTSHDTQPKEHNKNPQLNPTAFAKDTPNGSRRRDQPKNDTDANAPWGHSGNLKKGTSPEGKRR